jgi:hypothetical protein
LTPTATITATQTMRPFCQRRRGKHAASWQRRVHNPICGAAGTAGRLDDAQAIIKQLRDVTSVVVPSAPHWRNPEHREFYLEGLRMAATEA